jgi:hypothetical protein
MKVVKGIGGLLLLWVIVAPSCDSQEEPQCAPGATQQCFCPGGEQGAQVCGDDGLRWLECICGANDDQGLGADGRVPADAVFAEVDARVVEEEEGRDHISDEDEQSLNETIEDIENSNEWPEAGGPVEHRLPYEDGVHMGITQGTRCGGHAEIVGSIDFNVGGQTYESSRGLKAVASAAGTAFIRPGNTGYGNHVIVRHVDGTRSLYAHFVAGSFLVADGAAVCRGQPLGTIGQTGQAFGDHLHYELRDGDNRRIEPSFVELPDVPAGCDPCSTGSHDRGCYQSANALTCLGPVPDPPVLIAPAEGEQYRLGETVRFEVQRARGEHILRVRFNPPNGPLIYEETLVGEEDEIPNLAVGVYRWTVYVPSEACPGGMCSAVARTFSVVDAGVCANNDSRPCGTDEGSCRAGVETCRNGAWGICSGEVGPSAEACDGSDNDCDGQRDEGLSRQCQSACGVGQETCQNGRWVNCNAPQPGAEVCDGVDNDCDGQRDECPEGQACDNGQCTGVCVPLAEVCDGVDNDCDGQRDEGLSRQCQSACGAGQETCRNGQWVNCNAPQPGAEVCDGVDNDCDGQRDEALSRQCQSACGAGQETCQNGQWVNCNAPQPGAEVCDGVDNDCDGQRDECPEGQACENGQCTGICVPLAEVCDGVDNDCDGQRDEALLRQCQSACGAGQETCQNGQWVNCNAPQPGAEVCDGEDNDCDGQRDEALSRQCQSACGAGQETCQNGQWVNCNAPQPGAEVCDGVDNDCDGQRDEALSRQCQSACGAGQETCQNGQWVNCNAPQPGAEVCDGVDNDCDGQRDEALSRQCQSACGAGQETCQNGQWVNCNAPQPGAEVCDGVDNDCDGQRDEGAALCAQGQACQNGRCVCDEVDYWQPSTMEASDASSGITLRVEVRGRAADSGVEARVCGNANFNNVVHLYFEDWVRTNGAVLFDGALNGVGQRCTAWGRLLGTNNWRAGDGLGGQVRIISPSMCADEWENAGRWCNQEPEPGCGICWYINTPVMVRTCRQ